MKFVWKLCLMCGPYVECPACGNNCCNATYGWMKDGVRSRHGEGEECKVCELAYQYQDLCWENNLVPSNFRRVGEHDWEELDILGDVVASTADYKKHFDEMFNVKEPQ